MKVQGTPSHMHTENQEMVDYFAHRVPVSRFIVNSPGALGGIGASTGLMPSLTLGCGAVGGSATSENVGPEQLFNLRYVAVGKKSLEEIRKEAGDSEAKSDVLDLNSAQINEMVKRNHRAITSNVIVRRNYYVNITSIRYD